MPEAILSEKEKEILLNLAKSAIKAGGLAIEIGTWNGGSAAIIGEVCRAKHARLISIDVFNERIPGAMPFAEVKNSLKDLPVDFLVGDSRNVFQYLKDASADFIFIDGSHYAPVIKMDLQNFLPKLKATGKICGHDYTEKFKDVVDAVNEVFGPENIRLYETIWEKN